jgi:hypothetical protein
MIQQHDTPNGPAFSTEYRGTAYYASKIAGRWCVVSTRNATRAAGFGQSRWFDSLQEIEASLKGFSGLAVLVEVPA